MFRRKTVFVVGAGSSCELGLPSGDGLMKSIRTQLKAHNGPHGFGNDAIIKTLINEIREVHGQNWVVPMERYRERAAKICKALPYARSIDTHLESQKSDSETVFLGKLAIAQAILEAENSSILSDDNHDISDEKLQDTWYPSLARILTAGRHATDFSNLFANVSFIVFNYDRCLELYLLRMLRDYFAIQDEAAKVLSSATIVHAYGRVGSMVHDLEYVPFGGGRNVDLKVVTEGIKTYTEAADDGITARIKSLIENAQTIVFMGFGYIAQNMELLSPPRGSRAKEIFGTAYKMSSQDCSAVESKLIKSFGEIERVWNGGNLVDGGRKKSFNIIYENGTCRDLMGNNVFSLADQ